MSSINQTRTVTEEGSVATSSADGGQERNSAQQATSTGDTSTEEQTNTATVAGGLTTPPPEENGSHADQRPDVADEDSSDQSENEYPTVESMRKYNYLSWIGKYPGGFQGEQWDIGSLRSKAAKVAAEKDAKEKLASEGGSKMDEHSRGSG